MAPEIKKRLNYDGRKVDIFSTAVILFIIVNGIFPFKEATNSDIYYQLIMQGSLEAYWKRVGVTEVSWEFKDLIIKMLSPNGSERPSFDQIREHPWMKKETDLEKTRQGLIDRQIEQKSKQSSASTNTGNNSHNAEKRTVNPDDFKSPVRECNPKLPCKAEIT